MSRPEVVDLMRSSARTFVEGAIAEAVSPQRDAVDNKIATVPRGSVETDSSGGRDPTRPPGLLNLEDAGQLGHTPGRFGEDAQQPPL
jgi:hypothetical protein